MEVSNRYFGPIWDALVYVLVNTDSHVTGEDYERSIRNVHFTIEHGRGSIIRNPHRKLNYRFMVAEWLWNWYGRSDLASLRNYDINSGEKSLDGKSILGSWGQKLSVIRAALLHVAREGQFDRAAVSFLPSVPYSAGLAPRISSFQLSEGDGQLNGVVTMLREDVWRTLPYDAHHMCQLVNMFSLELGLDIGSVTFNVSEMVLSSDNLAPAIASIDAKTDTHFANRVGFPPDIMEKVLEEAPAMREKDALELFKVDSPWDLYVETLACLSPYNCHELLGMKC